MTSRKRRILFWAVIGLVLVVIGLRMYYVTCLRPPKIIKKWVQPDDVHYDEHDPYALALVKYGYELKWPLPRSQYYFVLGPSDSLLESGTWYYENPVMDGKSLLSGVDNWSVTWRKNGPTIKLSSDSGIYLGIDNLREKWKRERENSRSTESDPSSTTTTTEEHR